MAKNIIITEEQANKLILEFYVKSGNFKENCIDNLYVLITHWSMLKFINEYDVDNINIRHWFNEIKPILLYMFATELSNSKYIMKGQYRFDTKKHETLEKVFKTINRNDIIKNIHKYSKKEELNREEEALLMNNGFEFLDNINILIDILSSNNVNDLNLFIKNEFKAIYNYFNEITENDIEKYKLK